MIIAGAGIIGLSCAWRLAQKGRSVTVFDAKEAAREASWAGAGMLAPGGEIETGSEFAAMLIRSHALFPEFVRELEEESKSPIDYRAAGAVEVAFSDAETHALAARAARREELGIRSEIWSQNGLPARYYPNDAIVDPRDVTRALIIACERRGVTIHEHEAVIQIQGSGCGVRTARREYRDDAVLIAAGAWSSSLYSGLPRTMPIRGHLISYHLNPGFLQPILRHGSTYLLQRSSGVLIAGSSIEQAGFDRGIDTGIVADIHSRATSLLPALRSQRPTESWNGFRPGVESEGPMIGRIPGTSVWMAFGHYRNGILLAPETARMIAESCF